MANLRVLGAFQLNMNVMLALAIEQNTGLVDATATVSNAAGDYTVVLRADKGIDSLECFAAITVLGAAPLEVALEHVSDTQKRLRAFNNLGVLTAGVFSVVFFSRELI